jgi:beta-N-acetylhexosaminidase
MPTQIDLAQKALGQLFIIGFNGLELSDETAAFISQAGVGGVILFSMNYETPGQVAELSNQIQECQSAGIPLWVSVDHEGGRVQRFKKGFTRIPEAALIGATQSPKLVYALSEMMGSELNAVGVNLNFCPVADIATNPKNPVIGARAFGSDEDLVSKMVTAMVRGHLRAGVQACVKHFPGHGDTSVDSHFALPRVDTDLETLREREFKPFVRAFKSHCALVMTAHIIMTRLDPKFPATLSTKIVNEILRKEIRYNKVIITDDMEMKAITEHFGAEDSPRLAIQAGCDILCYRTETAARNAYASLKRDLESGKLDPALVLAAEARILALKKEVLLPYRAALVMEVPKKVGTPENNALVEHVIAAAVTNGYPAPTR